MTWACSGPFAPFECANIRQPGAFSAAQTLGPEALPPGPMVSDELPPPLTAYGSLPPLTKAFAMFQPAVPLSNPLFEKAK